MGASVIRLSWGLIWSWALVSALAGLAAVAFGYGVSGAILWSAGLLVLGMRAILHAARRDPSPEPTSRAASVSTTLVGTALVLAGTLLLDLRPGSPMRPGYVVVTATGSQALLAGLSLHPRRAGIRYPRLIVPTVGHGLVIVGSVYALTRADPYDAVAGVAYASGGVLLVLHAYWTERQWDAVRGGLRGWEPWLLLALTAGTLLFFVNSRLPIESYIGPDPPNRLTELATRAGVIVAVAVLADRPPTPAPWDRARLARRPFLAQAAFGAIFVNLLAIAFLLVAPWSFGTLVGIIVFWVLITAAFEYAMILHNVRRRRMGKGRRDPLLQTAEPIDALVLVRNEARHLERTIAENLRNAPNVRYLLVVSTASDDGSLVVAHRLAEEHADRVRVIHGQGDSKAADLAQAWPWTRTRFVLLLDADEILTNDAVSRAVEILDERPDVGIVQGRKVVVRNGIGPLSEFVAAERQFSTVLDHPFVADVWQAAHFAGSAALLRREVPGEAGGWPSDTLTEDIHLTLRIYTRTSWKIAYEPTMVFFEAAPSDLGSLIDQRTRWGRGWNEVFVRHLVPVMTATMPGATRRKVGLLWMYLNSFSASWAIIIPTLAFVWITGRSSIFPLAVSLALLALTFPTRVWSFVYAAWYDLTAPQPRNLTAFVKAAIAGHLWVLLGWLVQLRSIYLELSEAPRTWYGTQKTAGHGPTSPPDVASSF